MFKIMFALVTLSADRKKFTVRFDIFTLIIYTEAVRDSIWKEMWKNIIYVELTILTINEI